MDAPAHALEFATEEKPRSELSLPKVLVLCLACAFAGFALSRFLDRPKYPSASSATVGFLQDMHVHHAQALTIALVEVRKGESPQLRQMAVDIMLTQKAEMARMEDRLGGWGFDLGSDDRIAMAWMGKAMATPVRSMPGLATDDQLDELKASSGRRTDELFAQLMMVHHGGGVDMASAAAELSDDPWTVRMARGMASAQRAEIVEMRQIAAKNGFSIPNIAVLGDPSGGPTTMPAHSSHGVTS